MLIHVLGSSEKETWSTPLVDECIVVPREMRVYALSILAGRRRAATRPMSPNAARAIIATA